MGYGMTNKMPNKHGIKQLNKKKKKKKKKKLKKLLYLEVRTVSYI